MRLDFRGGQPAYLQIVRQVERQQASGKLRAGDQLPPVRALADQLGLNFNTVARAYRLLDRAGVVSTQTGRGTYILPKSAASRRPRDLASLVEEFFGRARRLDFPIAQIEAALRRRLARER